MTKEELKEALKTEIMLTEWVESSYANCVPIEVLKEALEALSAEPQEWISVKEHGKPKRSGKYWVTIQSTTSSVKWVRADEYHAERDFFDTEMEWSNSGIKITAWQPIIEPSPYKGDET